MRVDDRYELGDVIGRGGMGIVHRGTDTRTGETVAVKILKPQVLADEPEILERFYREAQALRQLNHPSIVKVLAAADNYIVMEYIAGGSLYDDLKRDGALSVERTLEIALDLADALTRAHRLDIVHRDLKPGNVLLAQDGTPRLTDFGVARIGKQDRVTETGVAVGTVDYLSPEALENGDVDHRADIWAFGVMLFEMLAARRPFVGGNVSQLITEILTRPVPDLESLRPDVPVALVDLIYRMLIKDVHARIPSVRLVGAEIEAILQNDTTTMQRIKPPDTDGRFKTHTSQIGTISLAPPNNLPVQPTSFVGRQLELRELHRLIDDRQVRLVTLTGPGGTGKTRLALAAAEHYVTEFLNGTYFIPLAQLDRVHHVVTTIADTVGFTFSGSGDHIRELCDYLAEKEMLLVMDNFEHLVDGASIIAEILQAAPNLQVLVTSRERLRLRGEYIFEVRGMILPDPDLPPENLLEYPAVQLFLQSAHRVAPDFALDSESASGVVRVCQLVQGLPLGIELAAAWLDMLSLDEITHEIETNLDFLETDLRDVSQRHRSIRTVFDSSWNMLTGEERDTFARLSIFRGGFEREAAQKVAGAGLRTLTTLINKSLLQRDPTGRYRLHRLLRQYAEAHFHERDDCTTVYTAHMDYYTLFLEKLVQRFNTHNEHQVGDLIELELENVRVAWDWALEHGHWEALDRMSRSMLLFYLGRSMLYEGIAAFSGLVEALQAAGEIDTRYYWRARAHHAWIAGRVGDYRWDDSSGAYLFFKDAGDLNEMADALNTMSYIKMMQGQYAESVAHAAEACELAQHTGDVTSWFMGMGNMGYAEYLRGNLEEARAIYEATRVRGEVVDYSPTGNAYGFNNMGEILRAMGEVVEARSLFEQAYAIFEQHKMRRGMAFTLNNLAGLQFMNGDHDAARSSYERAYELNKVIGDQYGIGHSLSALGNVTLFSGDLGAALSYHQRSLAIRRRLGDPRAIADSLLDLSTVAVAMRDPQTALDHLSEAQSLNREIGGEVQRGTILLTKGTALIQAGDYPTADRILAEAYDLSKKSRNDLMVMRSLSGLGEVALAQGRLADAREWFARLYHFCAQIEYTPGVLLALVGYSAASPVEADWQRRVLAVIDAELPVEISLYTPFLIDRLAQVQARMAGLALAAIDETVSNVAADVFSGREAR